MNKKSAQKQKRHLKTTASRKPLFHKKKQVKLQNQTDKTKIIRPAYILSGSLLLGAMRRITWLMKYVRSILNLGNSGILIEIECQTTNGLPIMVIVGLGNKAVDEARERIRSAFSNTAFTLPRKRITINLAPADIPKDSTSLDLPMAAAILVASNQIQPLDTNQALIGEIGLNGTIRPVRGIIGKLLSGRTKGITHYIVPADNAQQAALVPGVEVRAITSLSELQDLTQLPIFSNASIPASLAKMHGPTLSRIADQQVAKRAIEITAAGGHNLLLSGPPGTGKSLLAKALISILPPLNQQEVLEVTHLHSLSKVHYDEVITSRPFISPHSSASYSAVVGGSNSGLPGAISLSHHGILFMDEFPEFNRTIIESLRQPLEDGCITIARAKQTITYPARFVLVATANPCPCGYLNSSTLCTCTAAQIQRYRQKLSGPILDRIDLHVTVEAVKPDHILTATENDESDARIAQRVLKARALQAERFADATCLNAHMRQKHMRQTAQLSPKAETVLNTAAKTLGISARSYLKLIKVARTIADLEESRTIERDHILEALQYRQSAAN